MTQSTPRRKGRKQTVPIDMQNPEELPESTSTAVEQNDDRMSFALSWLIEADDREGTTIVRAESKSAAIEAYAAFTEEPIEVASTKIRRLRLDTETPFAQGVRAYYARDNNPYDADTKEFTAWEHGYDYVKASPILTAEDLIEDLNVSSELDDAESNASVAVLATSSELAWLHEAIDKGILGGGWEYGFDSFTRSPQDHSGIDVKYELFEERRIQFSVVDSWSRGNEELVAVVNSLLQRAARKVAEDRRTEAEAVMAETSSSWERTESTETKNLLEPVTQTRLVEIGMRLSDLLDEKVEIEAELKSTGATLRARIKSLEADIAKKRREETPIRCRWWVDRTNGRKELRREDTGEAVQHEMMNAQEREQLQITFDDRHPDDREGQPDGLEKIPNSSRDQLIRTCALALASAKYLIRDQYLQPVPEEDVIGTWDDAEIAEVTAFAETVVADATRPVSEMVDPVPPEALEVWWDSLEVDESMEQGDIEEPTE